MSAPLPIRPSAATLARHGGGPPGRRGQTARVLAIGSGKGGVGKTWLTTTLASAFGRAGRRALVVDCDVGLANVDVQLGVRPSADLHAVLQGWVPLEAAVTPVMGGPGRAGGFDIVAGHSGSGALADLDADQTAMILRGVHQRAAPHYDWVLLDLAAGLDAAVMRFALGADLTLLVINDEPTAMTDSYAFVKVMRAARHDAAPPWIAVNCAESRLKGRHTYDQFAAACMKYLGVQTQLAGVIGRDPRVTDAIRAQTPLAQRHPQSQALDDVMRIAETLAKA